jgi:3-oxoacyl-[acyl-carrier-protein] synthase-1
VVTRVTRPRIVVTGAGLISGAGRSAEETLAALRTGRSAIGPIRAWDTSGWPPAAAAEIADYDPGALTGDRKLLKLVRRSDVLGLHAADRAIDGGCLTTHRRGLDAGAATRLAERTGVYVGSGGGAYANQHDFLPLLATARGSLERFGEALGESVSPMWLLRSLPNNVLCHVGIRHGLRGSNACITNHAISGTLAIVEAMQALRAGECDRAVAVAHDAPIEPQTVLYYHRLGLLSGDTVRAFDAARSGTVLGEGAGALLLESEPAAESRQARVLGEILGGAAASEPEGLLRIRDDGDGLARAIALALDDAGIRPAGVGMIVAHGNGTRQGDASEARAIREVFGPAPPPVTAFKWAFGHLLAAAGMIDAVVALAALRDRTVPGVRTLRQLDPELAWLPVATAPRSPRTDTALVLSRGFGGTNAALLLRAAAA